MPSVDMVKVINSNRGRAFATRIGWHIVTYPLVWMGDHIAAPQDVAQTVDGA